MTARDRTAVTARARPRRRAGGFTLLEVLVSLGILIGALAGIASLLPAAGSRLADANAIDRAGTMAANARADLANRGLIARALWSGATPAIVFGEGLPALASMAPGSVGAATAAEVAARIDPTTGFQLRDVVQTTVIGSTVITGTGYEPGICYGCMLSSTAASPARGTPVRVTTVVFRKPSPDVKQFQLQPRGGGMFDIGSGADVAADRRRFLAGCSWVLSVGAGEPRWFQIAASWTAGTAGTSSLTLTGSGIPGGTLQVFGFDGLLRLDERFVNLE